MRHMAGVRLEPRCQPGPHLPQPGLCPGHDPRAEAPLSEALRLLVREAI